MAQQNINTGTIPNDKTGDSIRTAMIKVENNFTELYTTAPISNSVNIGDATSNVTANSTAVLIGNSGTYSLVNSSVISTTFGYYSQVLNSGSNNLVIGTTNATSVQIYTNGITGANLRIIVAANGNVGIGNSTPNNNLTVVGSVYIGNAVANCTVNSTFFTATANNTSFVGSVSAANVVSNAQLSANLSNYQTLVGLSANVVLLTANNTNFVGSVSAANVVSNAQLSANLSNYQTLAGISANVAALTANNTSFVGSVSAANVVSNAQLSANLSNYQTTAGLSANVVLLTANNSNYLGGKAEAALSVNNSVYLGGKAENELSVNNSVYLGGKAEIDLNVNNAVTANSLTNTVGLINSKTAFTASSPFQTSVPFTSIPANVKRITVMLQGVSLSGTASVTLQLGTSSGIANTGYTGTSTVTAATAASSLLSTGFNINLATEAAASLRHGIMILTNVTGNVWACMGVVGRSDAASTSHIAGTVTLASTLTQLRLYTSNGTDTFDAGTVNVLYE